MIKVSNNLKEFYFPAGEKHYIFESNSTPVDVTFCFQNNGEINGVPQIIYKDPKTDNGLKKSAVGLLRVNEDFSLDENVTIDEEKQGLLTTVFKNGVIVKNETLDKVRTKLNG